MEQPKVSTRFIYVSFHIKQVLINSIGLIADGSDYMKVLPTQLTFQPGETELCRQIIIIDDVVLEENEMFFVVLSTTDQAVLLNPSSATVTILNNDSESSPTKNIQPIATRNSKASIKIFVQVWLWSLSRLHIQYRKYWMKQ